MRKSTAAYESMIAVAGICPDSLFTTKDREFPRCCSDLAAAAATADSTAPLLVLVVLLLLLFKAFSAKRVPENLLCARSRK